MAMHLSVSPSRLPLPNLYIAGCYGNRARSTVTASGPFKECSVGRIGIGTQQRYKQRCGIEFESWIGCNFSSGSKTDCKSSESLKPVLCYVLCKA